MTAAIAAFRAGNAPHILQVFEVGTATMMAAKGAIVPVVQADEGRRRAVRSRRPTCRPVAGLLHRPEGQHAVVPLQQLHGDLLLQQGRLQEGRPRPEQAADDLDGGASRPPRSSRPPATSAPSPPPGRRWAQLESFSAWHNVPIAHQGQRHRRASTPQFSINTPLHVRHIENLADMAKQGLFVYAGRANAGGRQASSQRRVRDDHRPRRRCYGQRQDATPSSTSAVADDALLPRRRRARRRTPIIGGASLWVMGGKKPRRIQGRGEVLHLPVAPRGPGRAGTRAPATCRSPMPPTR